MCILVPIYLLTFIFMSKALQTSISKREKAGKTLLRKLVWLGKGRAKIVFICMMPKPKAYSSKKYKKFHGIASQKLSWIDQKLWKMEAKWKAFNQM